jgi:hypothetical protein
MPLSIEKRLRIIELYEKNQLHFTKGRFNKLKLLSAAENIKINELALRKLVEKWQNFGNN